MADPHLSVVLPACNEREAVEGSLAEVFAALAQLPQPSEVLVVDDGSTDGTAELVEAQIERQPSLRLIRLSRRFGKESALAAGLEHARGAYVALLDADLQDPPGEMLQMLAKAEQGYDVVYGVRRSRRSGLLRWLGYRAFYRLLRLISDLPVPLDSGDFSVLSRRVVDAIDRLPERHRFLRGMRTWVGFRQCGHLYDRPERRAGRSKYSLKDLCDLAVLGFLSCGRRPLAIVFQLGVALVGSGAAIGIAWAVLAASRAGEPWAAIAPWLTVLLVLAGVQLIAIGIVGAYLGRVLDQVEGRPRYLVERTVNCPPPTAPRP
ncbi:MAG: glycosyltransferase family 2 protein [Planctomycetes bacterium]|nr:glycosyltransferase family 2 protein [Planctomycetota bacterium]